VGLILDLAVVALALLVIGSLALLAWTLGFSAVRSTRDGRRQVADLRAGVADAESRIRSGAETATATLAELTARTAAPNPEVGPDE
jgi:hypothetical protein